MKSLRHLGLAVAILAVSGSALAGQGRHDHHQGRGYHHGPNPAHYNSYHAHPATQCKVKTKVSHHGRHYREEIHCKAPKHVHYSPRPVHVHRAPVHHVHVVHMSPPPPAVVIGPHGVRVHGTVSVGW